MRKVSITQLNICVSVIHQLFMAVCGLILPNMVLAVVLIGVFSAKGEVAADSIGMLIVSAVNVSLVVFPLFGVLNFVLQRKQIKSFLKNIR